MTVKFVSGKVFIEKGGHVVGNGRRSGQLYALDVFRCDGVSGRTTATMTWKSKPNGNRTVRAQLVTREIESDKPAVAPTRLVRGGEPVVE